MDIVLYPRPQLLARNYLVEQLKVRNKAQPVRTKNPEVIPDQWIGLKSQGGPRNMWEWRVMIDVYIYATDESVAEENSVLVHALMMDIPGVKILLPQYYEEPFPWVRRAQHISGPTSLEPDPDLPNLEVYRVVTTWHLLPIPVG